MSSFEKLDGIISAIKDEVGRPSPSHNNLARLTVLALEAIKEFFIPIEASNDCGHALGHTLTDSVGATVEITAPEGLEEEPKKRKSKKTQR